MIVKSEDLAAMLLPLRLRSAVGDGIGKAEEIRLRCGQAMSLLIDGTERKTAAEVTKDDLAAVLERASGASVHSIEDSLSKGYIGVSGGIRLGVCGKAVMKNGEFVTSSLS